MRSLSFLLVAITLLLHACGSGSHGDDFADISTFLANPSDQFLVDLEYVDAGHPFKGLNANEPHAGAHVHFENSGNTWPLGGVDIPSNYPPIYAVADGTINRVDTYFPVWINYRYGISLTFASRNGQQMDFVYSIEPMIDPGDNTFYEPYILVTEGQRVNKGDIIGYMYIPPNGGVGTHIHFHLSINGYDSFMAPAIFTQAIVDGFHARFNGFANDGPDPIPACMGYKLVAEENPFGTGAADCL